MAKLLWGVLCERVIIDRETNNTSHIDVIEGITVAKFPAIIQRLTLALMWKPDTDEEELQFRILANWPGATEPISVEPEKFTFEGQGHRFNLTLNMIKIDSVGELSFEIKQLVNGKWKKVNKFSYPVTKRRESQDTD